MPRTTRRRFFEESMIATAIAAAAASDLRGSRPGRRRGPRANETIRHAVIGCRIRGRVHAAEFGRKSGRRGRLRLRSRPPTRRRAGRRGRVAAGTPAEGGPGPAPWSSTTRPWTPSRSRPRTTGTPWPRSGRCRPARTSTSRSRSATTSARAGASSRSPRRPAGSARRGPRTAPEATWPRPPSYIRAGKLGEVTLARTIIYGRRGSIGPRGTYEVPEQVDYNLFMGPAALRTALAPEPPLRLALGLGHGQRRAGEQQHPLCGHLPLADGAERPGRLGAQRRRPARLRGRGRDAQHADGRPHLSARPRSSRRSAG